jgi:hypothetical protein
MPLPQKRWFRVADVAKRWAMPLSDIEDYALDDMLQLAVFVVDVPAEAGTWETGGGGGDARALQDLPILNGPQPLLRASLAEIFREGQAEIRAFRTTQPNNYLDVRAGAPAVIVRREDLIVTREERERFERDHAVAAGGEPVATDVWHSDDFTRVRVANEWHSFGPKQAAVLRLLKAASESDNPWLDGKRLLDEANAATMRLIDLFKRKPAWRQLVLADGKGRYRLNRDLLSPERGRVRFYRTFPPQRSHSRGAAAASNR